MGGLLLFLLINAVPAIGAERWLAWWRGRLERERRVRDRGYVFVSALLRTLVYAPCLIPVAMTLALPVSIPVFCVLKIVDLFAEPHEPTRGIFLFGIPQMIVFAVAYARADANRRREERGGGN